MLRLLRNLDGCRASLDAVLALPEEERPLWDADELAAYRTLLAGLADTLVTNAPADVSIPYEAAKGDPLAQAEELRRAGRAVPPDRRGRVLAALGCQDLPGGADTQPDLVAVTPRREYDPKEIVDLSRVDVDTGV
jgi:hypothetical protein